jgi:hypothetical protein
MTVVPPFDRSVFINCPFDEAYAPLLRLLAFTVVQLDFWPRLAPENSNNAAGRLDRILELISGSRWGIHDLSRCRAREPGEFARMNMPFELGLDHGCARFGGERMATKAILILEANRYDYQRALSDIAGWDIEDHGNHHQELVRNVRNWLVKTAGAPAVGASRILSDHDIFEEWYWSREHAAGASDDDIRAYPTMQLIDAMLAWREAGRPVQWTPA